jgi:hypothetical protein
VSTTEGRRHHEEDTHLDCDSRDLRVRQRDPRADGGAASGGLAGTWTSLDTDGSTQTLSITGSGDKAYAMVYGDESATGACNGAPARIVGPGFVDGNVVVFEGTLVCLPGGNPFRSRLTLGFGYDAGSDTLTDSFGIVWHRAR